MRRRRRIAAALLLAALAVGAAADRPAPSRAITLGGYHVLAADFHMHSSMWSDGALTPWGLVFEAQRQGLDVIAITGHNELVDGRLGRWAAGWAGGPIVLLGQEIFSPRHHVIAVGIEHLVDWRASVVHQVEDVHRQGGVAIAAHPVPNDAQVFDAAAIRALDGSEICHPLLFVRSDARPSFEAFAARGDLTPIGSSDFHGLGRLGMCRTYVFARDASAAAVIEAIRAHRTVVYGLDGQAYGDSALVALAATRGELRDRATTDRRAEWPDWVNRVAGLAGLMGLVLWTRHRAATIAP